MLSLAKVGEVPLSLGLAQALVQLEVLMLQRISPTEGILWSRCLSVTAAALLLVLLLGTRHFPPRPQGTMHLNRRLAALSWICLLPRSSFFLGPLPSEVLWLLSTTKAPLHY